VSLAVSGDVIVVGPGKYNESVVITTTNLSLFGAQAGKDARTGRSDPSRESIVDGSGTGNATITIAVRNVVVDGFTIQGGVAGQIVPAGVFDNGSFDTQILNNIIQSNSVGVYSLGVSGKVIEHNVFRNNNAGTATYVGYGVFASNSPFLSIGDNEFTQNRAAAIYVLSSGGVTITNNTSNMDGSFVVFANTSGGVFKHNQGKNFGAKGILPVFFPPTGPTANADAAVEIGPDNQYLEINGNDLEGGESPISNGIAFTTVLGTGPNAFMTVRDNKIRRFPGNGIIAEASSGGGTLRTSSISGNDVVDNGTDGILIELSPDNYWNTLFDNKAEGNQVVDCADDTTGTFTLGTANTWFNDIGNLSSPTGLCTPRFELVFSPERK
jgi:parallel beta-helix repeat protein